MSRKKQPADDKPLSIDEARGKISKGMSDLLSGQRKPRLRNDASRVEQQFEQLIQSGHLRLV